MAVIFEEPGPSPGKILWFMAYGCANTSLNKLPFALATTSIQTHSHLQSCYPANKEAQDFFCLWLCKRKLEQIPFCTCHNPNPKTRSSSQLLPTNKECASTPPEAELHKLCFAQCTVQCTPQCTATKRCKYHGIGVLLTIYKKLL